MCLQQSNLNFGQEINASSFVLEAAGLLDLQPEVLHVGEDHILHGLAKRSQSIRGQKSTFTNITCFKRM